MVVKAREEGQVAREHHRTEAKTRLPSCSHEPALYALNQSSQAIFCSPKAAQYQLPQSSVHHNKSGSQIYLGMDETGEEEGLAQQAHLIQLPS